MSNSKQETKTGAREQAGLGANEVPQTAARTCKPLAASPSITADAKYKDTKLITPLRCAIDSLYISYKGTLKPEFEKILSTIKEQAQHPDSAVSSETSFKIHDHKFEVLPTGRAKFTYVLTDNWFQIQLASSNAKTLPLAYIQIKSELLTYHDLNEILSHLDEIINTIGNVKNQSTISRLDLCMDFSCESDFDIENLNYRNIKTRASKYATYFKHKRITGWMIGEGNVAGRIYNKSAELLVSKKNYLKEIWDHNGWDCKSDVWRVEFQFRREFLSDVGLRYPHMIPDYSSMLWKYATTEWLQLVVVNPEDSNASRWPIHPAWNQIAHYCTDPKCTPVRKVTKERVPNDQFLFVNGISAISSFMAREGITDLGEALGEFLHRAETYHEANTKFEMEEYLRRKALEKSKRYNTTMKE